MVNTDNTTTTTARRTHTTGGHPLGGLPGDPGQSADILTEIRWKVSLTF